MNLPKYVKKDLKILENAEFKVSKYGFGYCDDIKMAQKLFQIASKYPQKHLEVILEYLGYFTDSNESLNPSDYRHEIYSNSEDYFLRAMDNPTIVYENPKKQSLFIEMGFIDCWYSSKRNFKASNYVRKFPSKLTGV